MIRIQYPGENNSNHQANGTGSTHHGQSNNQRPNHWQNANNNNVSNSQYHYFHRGIVSFHLEMTADLDL
jgi:hypothetical protein